MNLLLDTHIAIRALNDDNALSEKARNLILNPVNVIYYSVISVWEVHIKHRKKPENIPFNEYDFSEACQRAGFIPLNLIGEHIFVFALSTLHRIAEAREHNDPFDKILIAQAKFENLFFLTHDSLIFDYQEPFIVLV